MENNESGPPEMPSGLPPNRIETLVDGIFAVAMTILVLEIHVPDLAREASDAALFEAFTRLAPKILSYACGFVILGTIWIGHHYQFHYIRSTDRVLLWINLIFLLAISFLPFAIAFVGASGARTTPCVIYGANLIVAGTCLLFQWEYAAANAKRRLVRKSLAPEVISSVRNRVMVGMAGYGLGLAAAFVAPKLSLLCYAAVPLIYLVPTRIDRHVKGTV